MTILSDLQAAEAARYNRGRKKSLSPELILGIQRLVGVAQDGDPGPATAMAIARWQAAKEALEPDGKICDEILQEIDGSDEALRLDARDDDDVGDDDSDDARDDGSEDLPAGFVSKYSAPRNNGRGLPVGTRKWSCITGITLHQTACVFGKLEHRLVINVPAHAMTFADGRVALLNPPTARMAHAHGFNKTDIGIEVSCQACGVESKIKTFWRSSKTPDRQPTEATVDQLEATKRLVRYYVDRVAANGGKIQFIHAHRQSANKPGDPGSKIWGAVGVWAQDEFGLTTGDCMGAGTPIPTAWDPRIKDVPYTRGYRGY
jgi:hypothetical protein